MTFLTWIEYVFWLEGLFGYAKASYPLMAPQIDTRMNIKDGKYLAETHDARLPTRAMMWSSSENLCHKFTWDILGISLAYFLEIPHWYWLMLLRDYVRQ